MSSNESSEHQEHLRVFETRSEYHVASDQIEVFCEGPISKEAKIRGKEIREAFENGFLDNLISSLLEGTTTIDIQKISGSVLENINILVDSLTSEVGRALIGLSVMQLCIKSINPKQNVRLHKGSSNNSAFSWVEGLSMRTLDKSYVTPILRKYNLLRLNADGFMMTRSLAENYPYTLLYKANLRGARPEWLSLVEELEGGESTPIEILKYLLSKLISTASEFEGTVNTVMNLVYSKVNRFIDKSSIIEFMKNHAEESDYAARLFEISMHSLMQSAVETGAFGDLQVKPLSQMRSANKKHGNIGDIELLENDLIIEAWDAKYGKGYLREEVEEAFEKIQNHDCVRIVGFVTTVDIERPAEILKRINDIQELCSVEIEIIRFDDWVDRIYERVSDMSTEMQLSQAWLTTYCEYLCQRRRDNAPIDEPCFQWVNYLYEILNNI
jgi:hypothetical protein